MKEQNVVTQFRADLLKYAAQNSLPCWWWKIGDVPHTWLKAEHASKWAGHKPPFDVLSVIDGTSVAMEWKLIQNHGPISFSSVREHQEKALREVWDAGGVGLVAIAAIFELTEKIDIDPREVYRGKVYRIFFVPIPVWLAEKERQLDHGRKSVTQDRLQMISDVCHITRISRLSGRWWDVWRFLGSLQHWTEKYARERLSGAFSAIREF